MIFDECYGKGAHMSKKKALLTMIGFILLWAVVTDAWNYSGILFPAHMLSFGKYLYGYFSRILWMLPAILLIRGCERNLSWDRKQLFSRPKPEPVFWAFIAITALYALTSMAMNHHSILRKSCSEKAALKISAFLFAVLHWPAYFIKLLLYGRFDWAGILGQSISAFACGLLFAVMLKRSRTLWNPILAHFCYDWMLEVFT